MSTPQDSSRRWLPSLSMIGVVGLSGLGVLATGSIVVVAFTRGLELAGLVAQLSAGVLVSLGLVAMLMRWTFQWWSEQHRADQARDDLRKAEAELGEGQQLTLPALWEVTHRRLDYYHQIATGQARHSFRNAQAAMGVGFLLLVVFAVLALKAPTASASIVTGVLGAASAAFAAYISRTFVRSQEAAAAHLRAYFDQPLEFSRYLAAERLFAELGEFGEGERAVIVTELLRGMVAPSGPAPSGTASPGTASPGTAPSGLASSGAASPSAASSGGGERSPDGGHPAP